AHASSVGADYVVPVLDYLIALVHANEELLRRFSTLVLDSRPYTDVAAIAVFLLFTWRDVWNAQDAYRRLFSEQPLPAWRAGGVRDEHIELIRQALFFYILFLFYVFVRFPLTLGSTDVFKVAFDS